MEKIRSIKNKKGGGTFFAIAIILIVILLGVWGVNKYLKNRPQTLLEEFPEKLQEDINDVKNSTRSWRQVDYGLPKNFTEVCFKNRERDNLILKSGSGSIMKRVENVDLANITKNAENREFCVEVVDGDVEMILEKTRDNPKVIIKRVE